MSLAAGRYGYYRQLQIIFKELPSVRRSSLQSSFNVPILPVLPKQCLFCKREKYQKGSRTREKLTTCMQFRADKKIPEIAEQRNDDELLAITSDELIAKEAHYHASCYRTYTNFYQKKPPGVERDNE